MLTAAFWNTNVRDNSLELAPFFSTWTSFTPNNPGGWAATFTWSYAKYLKVGKSVTFGIYGVWASAGGGTGMNIGYPVTAANSAAAASLRGYILDSGTAEIGAQVTAGTTTYFSLSSLRTDGTFAKSEGINNTSPMTWAAGDSIWVGGTYEAAS